jgi:arsenate reductase-like glutaredoxin family protein
VSCKRSQEFLAEAGHEIKEEISARKTTFGADEACKLAEQASHVYVIKGKRVTHFNMKKDPPDSETLVKLLLGPTGNLRAPTVRKGKTLVVGFNAETYQELFG